MENIFQRPPILMRLTMLTRDKMSLLRAASLRTARETACGLNDRKQRGWVEAGILPLNYSRALARMYKRGLKGYAAIGYLIEQETFPAIPRRRHTRRADGSR